MNTITPTPTAATTTGIFHRARVRLFGERDPVAAQLRDIARQGASMAHLAHACAFALIILFSAGSLIALGGDALTAILAGWQRGQVDIPAAISIAVSTLLVLCCDVGMVYAASMLRLLATRRADASERRLHQIVMVTVAALEAATYAYMSARYEHPAGAVVWALILARACAAPLLSVYLSMARPLPITARDILYQAELAAGQGVIRDVVTVAADAGAPLADKMSLYGAAAVMGASDRARLDGMIAAVAARDVPALAGVAGTVAPTRQIAPPHPPTGGGSPAAGYPATAASLREAGRVLTLPAPRPASGGASGTRRRAVSGGPSGRANGSGVRTPASPARSARIARTATVERQVRAAWHPGMSVGQLERAAGISRNAAGKWRKVLLAEAESDSERTQAVAQ